MASGLNGLVSRKLAPELIASCLIAADASEVMKPKGTLFADARTCTRKSIPDISGMFQSERISLGCSWRSFSRAWTPFSASLTVSPRKPACRIARWTIPRIVLLSSTRRISIPAASPIWNRLRLGLYRQIAANLSAESLNLKEAGSMRDGKEFLRTLPSIAWPICRELFRRDGQEGNPEGPFRTLKPQPVMDFGPPKAHPIVASVRDRGH